MLHANKKHVHITKQSPRGVGVFAHNTHSALCKQAASQTHMICFMLYLILLHLGGDLRLWGCCWPRQTLLLLVEQQYLKTLLHKTRTPGVALQNISIEPITTNCVAVGANAVCPVCAICRPPKLWCSRKTASCLCPRRNVSLRAGN